MSRTRPGSSSTTTRPAWSTPRTASRGSCRSSRAGSARPARALGDPTRHEVFRYLADAERPVDVAELTDHLGLHHNAIRQHLTRLVEAGLHHSCLEADRPPVGRGRPRWSTRSILGESRWGVAGPYERLTLMLAEIIRSGDSPVDVGRRAGAGPRARDDGADPVAGLVARHGATRLRADRHSARGPGRHRAGCLPVRDHGARRSRHRVRAAPRTRARRRRFARRARHRRTRPARSSSRCLPPALSRRAVTCSTDPTRCRYPPISLIKSA
jgi:DNA-binding transcriptional ArsR family regulator